MRNIFLHRFIVISISIAAVLSAVLAISNIKFRFNFEDFFPKGDQDFKFYQEFKSRFEPDDHFLLISLSNEKGVFDSLFLSKLKKLSKEFSDLTIKIADTTGLVINQNKNKCTYDKNSKLFELYPISSLQTIASLEIPLKTPFGFTLIPLVHIDNPEYYESDKKRVMSDPRLQKSFISEDAKSTVVLIRTVDNISQEVAEKMIEAIKGRIGKYNFDDYHLLGRSYFQTELVRLQVIEFILSSTVSFLLVLTVMILFFRRFWGVVISISSIAVGLLLFTGYLSLLGKPLDSLALLYPIIMIICGTSDVIHIMSKYVDELNKGFSRDEAIKITIKEIGISVFLTSFTTAIGFLSLVFSKLTPIQNLGFNAAIGVMLAYATVMLFTCSFIRLFDKDKIIKIVEGRTESFWTRSFSKIYLMTLHKSKHILLVGLAVVSISLIGIFNINTNTRIESILPKGEKVTADFMFFEKNYSGFRPFEIAVISKNGKKADDYEVLREVNKLEKQLSSYKIVQSVFSFNDIYKSLNRAFNGDNSDSYVFPESADDFSKYQRLVDKMPSEQLDLFISKDKKFSRISSRVLDVGADSIKQMMRDIDLFISTKIDTNIVSFKFTGTGIMVDKNIEYVRDSLLQGLGFALLVISLVMFILYRNLKMLIVALIPNMIPRLVAGAILGFAGIPLEAGTAIVFSIIFGIAVDDTIHILGRFRILKFAGVNTEEAIKLTLLETGKAVTLTSVLLFFGFAILLFSSNPPAVTIGLLISVTLFTALLADVFLLPVLLRLMRI